MIPFVQVGAVFCPHALISSSYFQFLPSSPALGLRSWLPSPVSFPSISSISPASSNWHRLTLFSFFVRSYFHSFSEPVAALSSILLSLFISYGREIYRPLGSSASDKLTERCVHRPPSLGSLLNKSMCLLGKACLRCRKRKMVRFTCTLAFIHSFSSSAVEVRRVQTRLCPVR